MVELVSVSRPGSTIFTNRAINFGLLYWSMSIAVTVLVTALIVGRMLHMRHQLVRLVGRRHAPSVYFNVSAMLVESAALYTFFGILFLIGYAIQSPLQFVVAPLEVIQVRIFP